MDKDGRARAQRIMHRVGYGEIEKSREEKHKPSNRRTKRHEAAAKVEGKEAKRRLDRKPRASGGKNWIAGAIKHPGALHRELGVPEGEKIPAKKLEKASHSSNHKLAKRANLAKTLKKLH